MKGIRVHIDFETYSCADISKGAWDYSTHPSTEVLCMAYAINDEEPEIIIDVIGVIDELKELSVYGSEMPEEAETLFKLMEDPETVFVAHNAQFEYSIWENIMVPAEWPRLPIQRWDCTAVRAAACSLPRSLDKCAEALRLNQKKDKEGYAIMTKLCRPKKPSVKDPTTRYYKDSHPEMYKKLYDYCLQDVIVEREIDKFLPQLPQREKEFWHLDQKINSFGVRFDVETIENVCELLVQNEISLTSELKSITQNAISSAGQVAKIKDFIGTKDTQAETLEKFVEKTKDPDKKRVAEIRLSLASAAVKKYKYISESVDDEGLIRNTLMFNGASTGRWTSVGVQLHNFVKDVPKHYQTVIDYANTKDLALFNLVYGDLTSTIKTVLRPMIIPRDGKKLYIADFASIEARVLAWLVDEPILLPAFQAGQDVYVAMASYILQKPQSEIVKSERQLGKQVVLGCGYSMGAKRFKEKCAEYKLYIPIELAQLAVDTYRNTYVNVPAFWKAIQQKAILAIKYPGNVFELGRLKFKVEGFLLKIKLPSGRCLYYPYPNAREESKTVKKNDREFDMTSMSVYYLDKKTLKETYTYGGSLTENVVQAIARDLMAEAMFRVDAAGYDVLFTVHDEVVAESDDGDTEEFNAIMKQLPGWAIGCPVDAETNGGVLRYGK